MPVTIRILGPDDGAVLQNIAEDVFDNPVDARWSAEFLGDPRHHLAVALDDESGQVVGMATGVHYVHPDKPPELWVNEVGVASAYQGRGVGRRMLAALLAHAWALGCREAWVLTSYDNVAARHMYAAAGGVEEGEASLMITFALADGDGWRDPQDDDEFAYFEHIRRESKLPPPIEDQLAWLDEEDTK